MSALVDSCVSFLRLAFREEDALFSYSTRLDGGRILNDFDHPGALRYTINTYLGLTAVARQGVDVWAGGVESSLERFLGRYSCAIERPADLGLLTLLLAEREMGVDRVAAELERVRSAVRERGPRGLHMQDLGWMLWGATAAARYDVPRADDLAHSLSALIARRFVHLRSGLPRHSLAAHRRHVVSFGSLVYFLRAMFEYASAFGDADAREAFRAGAAQAIAIQGGRGQWPWMIDVRSGRPVDRFPVFSVHQDSMAMLFLHPALEDGLPLAAQAIERSVAWIFGDNELATSMVAREPFLIYRAIERDESMPRARRYLRSIVVPRTLAAPRAMLRINRECRSYHIGWILYAWAGREESSAWAPLGAQAVV